MGNHFSGIGAGATIDGRVFRPGLANLKASRG